MSIGIDQYVLCLIDIFLAFCTLIVVYSAYVYNIRVNSKVLAAKSCHNIVQRSFVHLGGVGNKPNYSSESYCVDLVSNLAA